MAWTRSDEEEGNMIAGILGGRGGTGQRLLNRRAATRDGCRKHPHEKEAEIHSDKHTDSLFGSRSDLRSKPPLQAEPDITRSDIFPFPALLSHP